MAKLPNVNGVCKVAVQGSFEGVPCVNVFHVGLPANQQPWSQAEASALANDMALQYDTHFLPRICSKYTMSTVTVTDLTNELGVVASTTEAGVGRMLGQPLTANVAQCITWNIARHYRGGHPRTYLPAPSMDACQNSNSWTTQHADALSAAASAFRDHFGSTPQAGRACALVTVHRYRGKDEDTGKPIILDPPLVDIINDASFDTRVDTMRRRLGADR